MADERCVFPGDDSRAPGRWLDRGTAERLLNGEPLDTADAGVRAQADRLAGALDALTATTATTATTAGTLPAGAELPGEDAALAAFRTARTGRSTEPAGRNAPDGRAGRRVRAERSGQANRGPYARTNTAALVRTPAPGTPLDAGLVRLGPPARDRRTPSPWGLPVRYGLAAALAAGMIGGVAVAATTGVLAFGGEEPEPGASATAAVAPDRPSRTPSPTGPRGDGPRTEGGGASPGGTAPGAGAGDGTDTGPGARSGSEDPGRTGGPDGRRAGLASACRDHRDGKDLDPGRRRTLEDAAHGAGQVEKYCKGLLEDGERNRDQHRDRSRNQDGEDPGDGRSGPGSGHSGPGDGGNGGGDPRSGSTGGGAGNGDGGGGKDRGDDRGHVGQGTFKSDKSNKSNKSNKSDKSDQGDKNDQGDKGDRSGRSDRADRGDRNDRGDQGGRAVAATGRV